MRKIKLFCMQKNEEDILDEWILYHSYLFGIENIHIIDNNSSNESLEILHYYQKMGLNIYTLDDYSKKGDYICDLIKQNMDDCDIAIPLDIDEFIGLHQKTIDNNNSYDKLIEKNKMLIFENLPELFLSCDKDLILKEFSNLPKHGRYAFKHYLTSRNNKMDYDCPIEDVINFDLVNMENHFGKNCNKKFFWAKELLSLDHGNHYGKVKNYHQLEFISTDLILFHYHHRGIRKLIEKCKNDILGLKHVKDINNCKELLDKIKQGVPGSHNISTYLKYYEKGPLSLTMSEDEGMKIYTLSEKIKYLKSELNHYGQNASQ